MKKLFTLAIALIAAITMNAALTVKSAAGWQESAYLEFEGMSTSYAYYNAYVSADGGSQWTALDGALVRSYGTYGRVDAVGLAAGTNYKLKVVPVVADAEVAADAVVSQTLTVTNYDRSGFAHMNMPNGIGAYNNDGTLKANAVVIYVTAASAKTVQMNVAGAGMCTGLQAIITGYEKNQETRPLAVRFIGLIQAADMDAFGSSSEGIQVKGRSAHANMPITFEGIGNDAMIRGFGFLVRNSKGVEFRNFAIKSELDDDLSFDTDNSHCWSHNMDLFYGPHKSGDQAKGDGALDIKGNSQYMTVSYCHFWDTGKSTMCGMKQDTQDNYITYHHNWFDHSDSRHARIRRMSVHMYNNYYDGVAKYGVGATNGCSVFMEGNYFRNTPKPMLISLQGTDIHMGVGSSDETKGTFSGETGGIIKSYGNAYSGSKTLVTYQQNASHFDCWEATNRADQVPAAVKTLSGNTSYNNFDTDATKMYTYTADPAANVPAIVTGDKGAGRLQHGDFQWNFTNDDDADYAFNQSLANALTGYTSSMVAIIGNYTAPTNTGGGEQGGGEQGGGQQGGGQQGGGQQGGGTSIEGTVVCHFTGNKPSMSAVELIAGSYSTSKGSVTYGGTNYSTCIKMESSTDLRINTATDCQVTVIFGGTTAANGKQFYLDEELITLDANGQHTFNAEAGTTYQLSKKDGINLFLVVFVSTTTDIKQTTHNLNVTKALMDGHVVILRNGKTIKIN